MIIVYGKDNCGSCEMVKRTLIEKGMVFEYDNLDHMPEVAADAILQLAISAGLTTYPIIMDDGNVVSLRDLLS